MSLAYLVDRFPVPSETFIARELEGLAALGVRPLIFALRPAGAAPRDDRAAEIARGVRVLPSPCSLRTAGAKLATMLRSPGRALEAAFPILRGALRSPAAAMPELMRSNAGFALARELAREGATHLHAHFGSAPATVAWLAARLAGVPWSVSVHARDVFANPWMTPEKLLAARMIVTCTGFARTWLLQRYRSLRRERVVTVHHGIDAAWFAAVPFPGGRPRFMAVGRLVPKKGFGVLLRAFARARAALLREDRDAELVLAGEGPERARLEALAAALGLGSSFAMTGGLSQDRVREEMARATCLVAPSVRGRGGDMDGLPNVILEAMATARPVVASRIAGIPEAVEDGATGILAPPGDEEALARAMLVLARDRRLAARMGAAGRRAVERRFTVERSAAALAAVFEGLGAARAER